MMSFCTDACSMASLFCFRLNTFSQQHRRWWLFALFTACRYPTFLLSIQFVSNAQQSRSTCYSSQPLAGNSFLSPHLKWHLNEFNRFCTAHGRIPILYSGPPLFRLKIAPQHGEIWTLIWHMVPWAQPSAQQPKQHLDQFSSFCVALGCDRPTDRPCYCVCNTNNRLHLHSITPCPCSPMVKPLGRHVQ